MKVVLFCHSLLSDWNHGNAHFLRGLVTELASRGHDVMSFEPRHAWSVKSLIAEAGRLPLNELERNYPLLRVHRYARSALDLDFCTDRADLVIVHEWNDANLVARLGRKRKRGARFTLLYHDTHHRKVSGSDGPDLDGYDGVLAFGAALRERYARCGWGDRAYTFHEAADTRIFRPFTQVAERGVVWVGNFGDDERTAELEEYLFGPVRRAGAGGTVYGVRYPDAGLAAVRSAGLRFAGWLPNFFVPQAFAEHRVTVHVPRRPYTTLLPGIPTIRVFEALACGIPLLSAPWSDDERLFRPDDFVLARSGAEMESALRALLADAELRAELSRRGLETIHARHTCVHRATELLAITETLRASKSLAAPASASGAAPPWD